MTPRTRLSMKIRVDPHHRDHRFEGRAVLPAVEALQLLAASVQSQWPDRDVRRMTDASFSRFLFIEDGNDCIAAVTEIQTDEKENLIASLLTLTPSPSGRVTRMKEHVRVCFPKIRPDIEPLPFAAASRRDDACFEISPGQLYAELVPFGPAFQNVGGILCLTAHGAAAQVRATVHPQPPGPLGSPFTMDAALHCACAWGQRYAGLVAFPVGFEKRFVFRPTVAGQVYFVRVIPVRRDAEPLVFNLWIYGLGGALHEAILGVAMRDVSSGRLKPPAWIRA
ncbi:MAG: polyketide synthase dehydratase domain-containing protein [Deltaproteobacteria bacterium]|nr:polyketide synthase dehydratase domain-containing protein [Deltaproteobacteria bacterium]